MLPPCPGCPFCREYETLSYKHSEKASISACFHLLSPASILRCGPAGCHQNPAHWSIAGHREKTVLQLLLWSPEEWAESSL